VNQQTVRTAHEELRDIYVAAVTAARNFSIKSKSGESAEAMGLACDATRLRALLQEATANELLPKGNPLTPIT
jgi:hypothetical protein